MICFVNSVRSRKNTGIIGQQMRINIWEHVPGPWVVNAPHETEKGSDRAAYRPRCGHQCALVTELVIQNALRMARRWHGLDHIDLSVRAGFEV